MTNKEIRTEALEQLKGNRIKLGILTIVLILIFTVIEGVAYNYSILPTAINFFVGAFLQIYIYSIYLKYERTEKIDIFIGFRKWKTWLKFSIVSLIYSVIIFGAVLIVFATSAIVSSLLIGPFVTGLGIVVLVTAIVIIVVIGLSLLCTFIIYIMYFACPYLLLDGLDIFKSLSASRELMRGHKWQLIKMNFSFLGWFILSVITLGIGFFWLIPYYKLTMVKFYKYIQE